MCPRMENIHGTGCIVLQETRESEENDSVNELRACNGLGIGNDDTRHPAKATPVPGCHPIDINSHLDIS